MQSTTAQPKNYNLSSVELVAKRNLAGLNSSSHDVDDIIRKFATVTHCRLDREHLRSVPILTFLPNLTNLYLQCNHIERMANFSVLLGLRFLTLAENIISKIEGIKDLPRLGFLDLTENRITTVEFAEIPRSLVILNISENPCCDSMTFTDDVTKNLPNLRSLDGQAINADEVVSTSESEESGKEDAESDIPPSSTAEIENNNEDDFYDDLSAQMSYSFQNFREAINERSKVLQSDFTEFTSIPPPTPDPHSKLSDKEIADLEREVAKITVLKPIEQIKKPVPRPPVGSKSTARTLRRPVSGSSNTTTSKVRTPGARPFRRVIK